MLKPESPKTFKDYSQDVFLSYVNLQLDKVQWCGRKEEKVRRRVSPNTAAPQNWAEFLRFADNKKELFYFLSKEVITI
jgi:hypothetical protein